MPTDTTSLITNTFLSLGAIAGIIAFLWKAFESYAASSTSKWDDKVVQLVNQIAVPLVDALEKNAAVTASNTAAVATNTDTTAVNTAHTADNTSATVVNTEVTAPAKS